MYSYSNCKKLEARSYRFFIFERDFTQSFETWISILILVYAEVLGLCKPFLLLKKQVCVFKGIFQ